MGAKTLSGGPGGRVPKNTRWNSEAVEQRIAVIAGYRGRRDWLSRLTNSRIGPWMPSGNCRKNESPV